MTEMNPFKSRLENSSLPSGIPWGDGPRTTGRPWDTKKGTAREKPHSILPYPSLSIPSTDTMSTSGNVITFGSATLNQYSDRQDFWDWLEVLEFLGFLQALIFDTVSDEEHYPSRGGLAIAIGATIQIWRRAIDDAFRGTLNSTRQRPLLLNSMWPLREAMAGMNLIARSTAGAMELARNQIFNSDMGADEPSLVAHGPHCLV